MSNNRDWAGASGLPAGLAFDSASGVISGIPLQLGDFPVSVQASNRYGVVTGSMTIRVSTVAAWGDNSYAQTDVPAGLGDVVAVAGGGNHNLALRADGTVVAWGDNSAGQTDVPFGLSNVVAVAGGGSHSVALRADGSVAAWGGNWYGQTDVPSGLSNVVAIAVGDAYSLALRADGTVAAWGDDSQGQTDVPTGLDNILAIAGAWAHSIALRADGSVAAWGANYFGQTNVPSGLSNVIAVSGGGHHSLALVAPQPIILNQPVSRTNSINTLATFSVTATGNAPLTYQWRRNGTNLMDGPNVFGATAAILMIANVQPSDAGNYTVVVTNAYGSVTSQVAVLTMVTSLGDDFNGAYTDPTKWGPDIHLGAGGQLVQTNGLLQFQGGATVLRPWIGSYGSYTQDWEVIADVNVGNLALTQNKAYARVFLGVADHHDLLIQNGWSGDTFSIALNVYYETPGPISRVFESVVQTNGVVVSTLQGTQNTTNQHASLRISFSAATKTLTAWYDISGSTNSHTWVPLSSLGIDGSDVNWDMTDASAFRLALGASSRSFTVSASDQVYADNFAVV
ncbi:MAG: immunoglobulin domain-containing protein, partial [Verrucomicrobia bacterium]|nr:immunoglobulin domain-containing protein [Verrucomicrobiota bacterium]